MKSICIIILLFFSQILTAGSRQLGTGGVIQLEGSSGSGLVPPALVASPFVPNLLNGYASSPFEDQAFDLWQYRVCGGLNLETDVIINGNHILFFGHVSSVVPSPCPPHHYSSELEISGLDAGIYNLSYYAVPSDDVFPPNVVDYPAYFIESSAFEVLQAYHVDTLSLASLLCFSIALLSVGFFFMRKI